MALFMAIDLQAMCMHTSTSPVGAGRREYRSDSSAGKKAPNGDTAWWDEDSDSEGH